MGAYSVSLIRTFVSACSRINDMDWESRRVFKAFSTAPVMGTPNVTSKAGGTFGAKIETVSPFFIPLFLSAEAKRKHLLCVSRHVNF